MRQPFRRYAFGLAERLGYGHPRIMYKYITAQEIMEWMAYDQTTMPEYVKKYNDARELEEFYKLSLEQQCNSFRRQMGGG
jgi:hypothetical protein